MKTRRSMVMSLEIAVILAALGLVVWVAGAPQATGAAPSATLDKFLYLPIIVSPPVYDWLQFGFDPQHSGNDTKEIRITANNVISLQVLFQKPLPFGADGAPAYLSGVSTYTGTRDLVFVTTMDGHIAALDAHTGTQIWVKFHGPGGCLINNDTARNETCYTTSSPAIDPGWQYVYSYGLDGYVHKFAVGDGTESLGVGWPEAATLKGYDEKGSSALSIATANSGTSYLYVAHGGYPGDAGNYQGHITAVNLTNGTQKVFNTLCSNQTVHFVDSRVTAGSDCSPETQSAIWARPGVVYDRDKDQIFMATGNGTFQPSSLFWGDTVFSLNPDGSGVSSAPRDTYTPVNFQQLQNGDTDLGSTAPAILPPSAGVYAHLAVQSGKDSVLRLLNLDNLSGHTGTGFTGGEVFSMSVPMGGEVLTQLAVWTNLNDNSVWVFVANDVGIAGLQLKIDGFGKPSLQTKWTKSGGSNAGTSPIIANGVLFYARSHLISALDPITGNPLWSDNHIGGVHWSSPIVANGMLYFADQSGRLTAYALP